MTARQDILAALRSALDSLAEQGTDAGWQQTGVIHEKSFARFDKAAGRGRWVYAWLGPETNVEEGDAPAVSGMQVALIVWGKVNVDTAIIDDVMEEMVADLKRAILLLDDAQYPNFANQTSIKSVTPDVISDSVGSVIVEGSIRYYENAR